MTWHETREEMPYEMPPQTEFQKYIRLFKHGNFCLHTSSKGLLLFDYGYFLLLYLFVLICNQKLQLPILGFVLKVLEI